MSSMTDLTERLREEADHPDYSASDGFDWCQVGANLLHEAATTLETLTQEVERLRGLLIDPGDPAWEDARAILAAELRKADMGDHAEDVAAGRGLHLPSWITLNLIAHSRRSLTQENARLKAVSDDHFRNAQRLAGEVAKRDVENARLREAGWRDIESAPKDGARIIIAKWGWAHRDWTDDTPAGQIWHLYFAVTASFDAKRGCWTDGLDRLVDPTHWMPLPPAPARKALGGGDEQ